MSLSFFPDDDCLLEPVGGDAGRDVDAAVVEGELLEAGALHEEVEQGERAAAAGARQTQPGQPGQRREEEREVAQVQAAEKKNTLQISPHLTLAMSVKIYNTFPFQPFNNCENQYFSRISVERLWIRD